MCGDVTGTALTLNTYLTAHPSGQPRPMASNLNLVPGQTAANAVTVGGGYSSIVEENTVHLVNNAGYVDLIFDVAGFFVTTE